MYQISRAQNIITTPEYIGYLILKDMSKKNKVPFLECFSTIQRTTKGVSYKFIIYALIFLYINSLIDFDGSYFYFPNKK
jgi:hypothetical protein